MEGREWRIFSCAGSLIEDDTLCFGNLDALRETYPNLKMYPNLFWHKVECYVHVIKRFGQFLFTLCTFFVTDRLWHQIYIWLMLYCSQGQKASVVEKHSLAVYTCIGWSYNSALRYWYSLYFNSNKYTSREIRVVVFPTAACRRKMKIPTNVMSPSGVCIDFKL